MRSSSIYIPAGVTSSLFASLLPSLSDYTIYATVRPESNPTVVEALVKHGVLFVPKDNNLHPDRILWLSTHDDVPYLSRYVEDKVPILAINSGAIMDILTGRQDEATANAYQKSKLALHRAEGIYNIIPGFFIQDLKDPEWASKGLHGDTTVKLFSTEQDPNFDWGKAYSVTPKSYIVAVITNWLSEQIKAFPKTSMVCSDRQYRRFELRQKVFKNEVITGKGTDLPILTDPIYKDFPHPPNPPLTEKYIDNACENASLILK